MRRAERARLGELAPRDLHRLVAAPERRQRGRGRRDPAGPDAEAQTRAASPTVGGKQIRETPSVVPGGDQNESANRRAGSPRSSASGSVDRFDGPSHAALGRYGRNRRAPGEGRSLRKIAAGPASRSRVRARSAQHLRGGPTSRWRACPGATSARKSASCKHIGADPTPVASVTSPRSAASAPETAGRRFTPEAHRAVR